MKSVSGNMWCFGIDPSETESENHNILAHGVGPSWGACKMAQTPSGAIILHFVAGVSRKHVLSMVVVGNLVTFLLVVVWLEIPT